MLVGLSVEYWVELYGELLAAGWVRLGDQVEGRETRDIKKAILIISDNKLDFTFLL